jgi:hypothetical protein
MMLFAWSNGQTDQEANQSAFVFILIKAGKNGVLTTCYKSRIS